jgi:O-antigen/teichoic acid export membrane protein
MPPSVVGVLLNFLFTMAAIALHGPLTSLIAAALLALIIQWAWVLKLASPLPLERPHIFHNHWGMLLREAWPLGIGTAINGFMQQAPAVLLSFVSLEVVGAFSAANRIPQILALLPLMINTSSFPLLSHLAHHNRAGFRVLLDHLLGMMVLVCVPLAIFMAGSATTIIHFLFTNHFLDAAAPLAILGISLALGMPALILGEAMVTAGKQRLNLLVQVFSLATMAALLWQLIPSDHAVGAATAIAASNGILLGGTFLLGRVALGRDLPWQPLGAGLVGAAAGTLTLFALRAPWGVDRSSVAAAFVSAVVIAALERHTTMRLYDLILSPLTHRGKSDRRRTPRARLVDGHERAEPAVR